MRVVFLDMDGVMNSHAFFEATQAERDARAGERMSKRAARRAKGTAKALALIDHERMVDMIDPAAVPRLNAILNETGAVCVLSSSWRIPWPFPAVEEALRACGFTGQIIDCTPNGAIIPPEWVGKPEHEFWRGIEIAAWLDAHPGVESFVILDDSADMAHLLPRLVRTSWHRGGLLDEHVSRAVELLRTPPGAAKEGK